MGKVAKDPGLASPELPAASPSHALARADEVFGGLVQVVLTGGGLDEVADALAGHLEAAVYVTTTDGRVLAEAGPALLREAALASTCFDPSGRLRVETEPRGVHAHPGLLGSHALVPVVAGTLDHGRLVAFAAEGALTDSDVRVLDRAATVAALAITRRLAVAAVESKYRGDFLRDVLAGQAGEPAEVVAHCASLGWDVDRAMVVLVAELDPDEGPDPTPGLELRPAQERFAAAWATVLRPRDPTVPVAGFNREVVVLLGVAERTDVDRVVRELVRAVSGDGGGGRRSFSTGVSRVVAGPAGLAAAYRQAHKAVRVGRQVHGRGAVAHFDELGVYRLLSLIPDADELRGFVAETLGELGTRDDEETADLRHTLEVLLECNLNVAEASRVLHFHYNTLRYRIGKLERLLGPFTTDSNLRLDLALALRVLRMRGL